MVVGYKRKAARRKYASRKRTRPMARRFRSTTGRKRTASRTVYSKRKRRKRSQALLAGIRKQPFIQDQVTFGGNQAVRRHKYVTSYEQAILTYGSADTRSYRANGIFDPTVAVGGHQPYGYDQMIVFFGNYQVLASKIRVREVIVDTISGVSPNIYIYKTLLQNDGPVEPNYGIDDVRLIEQGLLNLPVTNGGAFAGTKGDKARGWIVTNSYNAKSLKRYSKDHDKKDYTLKASTDPTGGGEPSVLFHIRASNSLDAGLTTADTRKMTLLVEIEYVVLWSGKITQSRS